jgi:hypothetical protein
VFERPQASDGFPQDPAEVGEFILFFLVIDIERYYIFQEGDSLLDVYIH